MSRLTIKQQNAVDHIMDRFDYRNVLRVMKFLKWKWQFENGEYRIPDEYDLRQETRQYLKRCFIEKESLATGGFTYQYFNDDGEYINMSFVIEDCSG